MLQVLLKSPAYVLFCRDLTRIIHKYTLLLLNCISIYKALVEFKQTKGRPLCFQELAIKKGIKFRSSTLNLADWSQRAILPSKTLKISLILNCNKNSRSLLLYTIITISIIYTSLDNIRYY